MNGIVKFACSMLLDITLSAGMIGGNYVYNYKIPHQLQAVNNIITAYTPASGLYEKGIDSLTPESDAQTGAAQTAQKTDSPFSDTVVSTKNSYKSPDISIELSYHSYDSRLRDYSESGKHVKYGSFVAYVIADVYVKNISSIQTCFAKDIYGVGYGESLTGMSRRIGSLLAVNGDSYSNNRHQANGTIIRNGIVYRTQPSTEETCVLFKDGTMKIYTPSEFDAQTVIDEGAWQSWVFGPSLLDENGKAKTDFLTWDYIRESHPRTAIGYYEPGHYCLMVVDGREPGRSRGMFLDEMSQIFAELGCKAAYNLDGGHCSFMTLSGTLANDPYKPGKSISDCIAVVEPKS